MFFILIFYIISIFYLIFYISAIFIFDFISALFQFENNEQKLIVLINSLF